MTDSVSGCEDFERFQCIQADVFFQVRMSKDFFPGEPDAAAAFFMAVRLDNIHRFGRGQIDMILMPVIGSGIMDIERDRRNQFMVVAAFEFEELIASPERDVETNFLLRFRDRRFGRGLIVFDMPARRQIYMVLFVEPEEHPLARYMDDIHRRRPIDLPRFGMDMRHPLYKSNFYSYPLSASVKIP